MRIAIVGGGIAGLAAAWMLQDEHEVTLMEKETWLGGHARSLPIEVEGKVVHAETGFKYLMFPSHRRCFALLDVLKVPLRHWQSRITLVFEDEGGRTLVLPPRSPSHVFALLGTPKRLVHVAALSWFSLAATRLTSPSLRGSSGTASWVRHAAVSAAAA